MPHWVQGNRAQIALQSRTTSAIVSRWPGPIHSGIPGETAAPEGDPQRVLRAPTAGVFTSAARIGEHFEAGQTIAQIEGLPIVAPFAGVLRGLLRPGTEVEAGLKVGDIDPRDDPRLCQLVSDKSLAVAGGVLEAILSRAAVRTQLWA